MKDLITGALVVPYRKAKKGYEFLLLKHQKGFWTFPGGRIENTDKSIKSGLIREIKEETGLAVNTFDLVDTDIKNEFIYDSVKPDRAGKRGTTHFFLLKLKGNENFSSFDKIVNFGWFSKNKVLKLLPYEGERTIFRKLVQKLSF